MPANYVLLERVTLTATTASIVFDNIPQTGYTDLKVVFSARTAVAGNTDVITLSVNGSNANLTGRYVFYNGNTGFALNSGTAISGQEGGFISGNTSLANTFSNCEIYFPNYTSTTAAKPFLVESTQENTAIGTNSMYMGLFANQWSPGTQASINSLTFAPGSSFLAGTTFSIYGIAALGTTPEILPKATGGDIVVSDGTYWYHAFLGSSIFTPSQPLSCDVLVVAGGGGAGPDASSGQGAGGGAGGIFYATSQTVTSAPVTITVGAGGAGKSANSGLRGDSGGNSVFGALTAAIGGGGGGPGQSNLGGASGGSGGGGGGGSTSSGAGGSSTQTSTGGTGYGNAGGSGVSNAAGGGGGSGAAGGNGSGSTGGTGGIGLNTWSSWASATGTGDSGYFASGGNGWATAASRPLGGGGPTSAVVATASGYANTGGGGGGFVGNGGSGIIIVRYSVA